MLDTTLVTEGLYVELFTSQIEPPASLKKTIDEKNQAEQAVLKAKNEVEKAKTDAEITIAKAEGAA